MKIRFISYLTIVLAALLLGACNSIMDDEVCADQPSDTTTPVQIGFTLTCHRRYLSYNVRADQHPSDRQYGISANLLCRRRIVGNIRQQFQVGGIGELGKLSGIISSLYY